MNFPFGKLVTIILYSCSYKDDKIRQLANFGIYGISESYTIVVEW